MIYVGTSVVLAHLFAEDRGQRLELASYDRRMVSAARALGIPLRDLP